MLFKVTPPCRKQWHSPQIEKIQSVASSTICCIACSSAFGGQGQSAIASIMLTVQSTQWCSGRPPSATSAALAAPQGLIRRRAGWSARTRSRTAWADAGSGQRGTVNIFRILRSALVSWLCQSFLGLRPGGIDAPGLCGKGGCQSTIFLLLVR